MHAPAKRSAHVQSNDSRIGSSSAQNILEQTSLSPAEDERERSNTPAPTVEAPVPKDSRLVTDATGHYGMANRP